MADLPVGVSEYGDLRGVMQTLQDEAGRQFIAWMNEAHRLLGRTKATALTINEGRRPRARCELLWNQYVARDFAAPRVATLYTSNHLAGTAGDIGGPGAAVLTSTELAVLHSTCEAFGWFPTGLGFGELWHFDYLGGATKIAKTGIQYVYPSPAQIKKATTMSTTQTDDATVAYRMTMDRETNEGKTIAKYAGQIRSRYLDRLGREPDASGLASNLRAMFLGRDLTYVDALLLKSAEYKSAKNQARLAAAKK